MGSIQKCSGLLGKIFGHKFITKLVESYVSEVPENHFAIWSEVPLKANFVEKNERKAVYRIFCKRCGYQIEDYKPET